MTTRRKIAHFGEALRRELHGEGVLVLSVYSGATSTPTMASSQAGPEHGFDDESRENVAATIAGITDGSLAVIRSGQMIALNRGTRRGRRDARRAQERLMRAPTPA